MKSICFFSSYFDRDEIPYYIEVYLLELVLHFEKVVVITNDKKLNASSQAFLHQHKIELLLVKNEGYDFGMWSKGFESYPISSYDRVALINDSCILFSSLTKFFAWVETSESDYCGFSESYSISHHLQSYFLVMNKKAAGLTQEYFKKHGILPTIKAVIEKYEVGLSTYLLTKGLKIAAYLSNSNYTGEYSPYYYLLESHLKQGAPLIKKKIIYLSYRKDELFTLIRMNFRIQPSHYISLINTYNSSTLLIDFKRLQSDLKPQLNTFQVSIYEVKRVLFQLIKRTFKK